MKQYGEYKDSGIQWIGKIPSHWHAKKIKFSCNVTDGTHFSPPTREKGKLYITVSNVHDDIIDVDNANRISEDDFLNLVKQGCQPQRGDVLLAKDGTVGRTAIVKDNDYVVLSSLGILHPLKGMTSEYLKYSLDSSYLQEQMNAAMAGSALRRITINKISEFISIIPPVAEQQSIASYLDYKVGQIDAAIKEKELLLNDLKTYRSAIISEAVTKGLDKNAEMKDSGVEWIGKIPKHWKCARLKFLLSEPLQYGANEAAESNNRNWPRYIRITDIDEYGNLKEETFRSLQPDKARGYLLQKGDLLFARSGATVGKTFIFNEDYDACFAGYLIKARCGEQLLPMFLYYYTNSKQYENWKSSTFVQATIQNIGADKYSLMPIVVPSVKEQHDIVDFIGKKLSTIYDILNRLNEELTDLNSYKSSIITEAVTGKVDLRDWKKQKEAV